MKIRRVRSGGELPGSVRLPWKVRSADPNRVPPLVSMMKKNKLDPGKCPFFGPMNGSAASIRVEVHIGYRNYEKSIGSEA